MNLRLALLPALSVACFACQPRVTTRVENDVQSFCAQATDGSLAVVVEFATCISSSCDTVTSADCTLTEADGVVTLDAEAVIDSQGKVCTADCGLVEATCTLDLPDGTYTIRTADETLEITLPDAVEACAGVSQN